jgi:zinc transporter ZupT
LNGGASAGPRVRSERRRRMGNVWIALELTILAGLAAAIGSAIVSVAKRTDYRFLSVSTGFSAGVPV